MDKPLKDNTTRDSRNRICFLAEAIVETTKVNFNYFFSLKELNVFPQLLRKDILKIIFKKV